jgi:hypothetical protein
MRLTWKDGVTTAVMALVLAVYLLYTSGADVVFVSSVRGASVAILLLGAIGCGYGAADQLYKASDAATTRAYTVVASAFGATALVAGLIALIFGSEVALTVLFAATAALWLIATMRHLISAGKAPPVTGDVTEPRKEAKA